MKDKIIINTISKTHSVITSFLSFIALSLVLIFMVLQNGLYLENLSFANIHVKKVFIKWNDKLSVSITDITINSDKKEQLKQSEISKKDISMLTRNVYSFLSLFESITVENFTYDNFHGYLHYTSQGTSTLVVTSDELYIDTTLDIYPHYAVFSLKDSEIKDYKINLDGKLYVDLATLKTYGKTKLSLNKQAQVDIYTLVDTKQLDYVVTLEQQIHESQYKKILTYLKLPQYLHYWLDTAIHFETLTLQDCHGFVNLQHPQQWLQNLYVSGDVHNFSYKYNKQLDAVKAHDTTIVFAHEVLSIFPDNAQTYSFNLLQSYVNLDFSKKDVYLNLYLDFQAQINKNIHTILQAYDILLPLSQKRGTTDVKLALHLNLNTLTPTLQGKFVTDKGVFVVKGTQIGVETAVVTLNNTLLDIKKLQLNYKDAIDANISGKYDVKNDTGMIYGDISKFDMFKELSLTKKAKIVYTIKKQHHTLHVAPSKWLYKDATITAGNLEISLERGKEDILVSPVYLDISETATTFVFGEYNTKKKKLQLHVDLLSLSYKGLTLAQSNTPLEVVYDKQLTIVSKEPIHLRVIDTKVKLQDFKLYTKKKNIYFKTSKLSVGDYMTTKFLARINPQQKAHFTLNNIAIVDKKSNKILYKNNKLLLNAVAHKNSLELSSSAIRATFTLEDAQWKLQLNSLNTLYRKSPFLQEYKLSHGTATISKKKNSSSLYIDATIKYPFALTRKENKDIHTYKVHGKLTKSKLLTLALNDTIRIKVKDNIRIDAQNTNFNLQEILRFTEEITSKNEESQTNSNLNLRFTAIDSNITVADNRTIIANKINFQYFNDIATAQLRYKAGKAGFKLENKQFSIYGKNFNDTFMNALFAFSKFKGGHLDFTVNGTLDDYSGILYVEKTRLLEYTVLNNVLAFINTVPSLITFSVPGYTKNGIKINHAYLKFHYKEKKFYITDMFMDSKELKISSKGVLDPHNNSIDMLMTLKTDIASDVSKIPVVGYIIFDGKALSTTFKIVGKLEDPKIESQLAKEVIVAPLNIIKRTLQLPLKLFE